MLIFLPKLHPPFAYQWPDTVRHGANYFGKNALNYHYLPKMCIELALPLLDFVKVMH